MGTNYLSALITFLGGAVISIINAVITARQISSKDKSLGFSPIRQILSFAYLIAVYFVIRKLGIDQMLPLLGAAIGLTVPAILFAITIAKKMKGDD